MDDLDRLLLNVEKDIDIHSLKEDEKKTHEKTVRRGDKNIGEVFDDNASDSFDSVFERLKDRDEIQRFSENHCEGLKPHWNYVIDFKNILSDLTLPDPVIFALRKHKYNLLRSIENIEKFYDDFASTLSYMDIEKIAKQDYAQFFPGYEIDEQRIEFLVLKEIFLRMRELNAHIRKEWKSLSQNIKVMSLANESGAFIARCEDIIRNGINHCKDTDLYLEFIAAILYLPRKDFDVLERDIGNRIYFRESYDYDYRTQFKKDISTSKKSSESSQNENSATADLSTSDTKNTEHAQKVYMPEDVIEELRSLYAVPGKSSWNTKEPYIIKIDPDKLHHNEDDLSQAILFVTEQKSSEAVDAMVKRAMIRSMHNSATGVTTQYEEFIFKSIITIVEKMKDLYHGVCSDINLFIYHAAPMTIYNILIRKFHNESTGVIFKKVSKLKIARILPSEYIKRLVMIWFNENIHTKKLQFDKIHDYNQIKSTLHQRYMIDIEHHLSKIKIAVNHHKEKTGVQLDKNLVLHKRAFDLFTDTEIEVYLRFLDGTIFRK
ncbi:MAG: hypothetical protein PF637_10180 [Spirochaetes bacterium]|jgi:hypothetical protein|nr:hypothetical protein [Spirochaetota bacterium]